MSAKQCAVFGDKSIDPAVLAEEAEILAARIDARRVANGGDLLEAQQFALKESKVDAETQAMIKKRNRIMNSTARFQMEDFIRSRGIESADESILSLIWGGKGNEHSAASVIKSAGGRWFGELHTRIEGLGQGTFDMWKTGKLDHDIVRALYAKDFGNKVQVDPRAQSIADALSDTFEVVRRQLNEAGAFIPKKKGWIVNQSHDRQRIRKAGRDSWRATVEKNLDYRETFGYSLDEINASETLRTSVNEALDQMWSDLASGSHVKAGDVTENGRRGIGTGGGNAATRVSQSRSIHFRDADAFWEYQKQFGTDTLSEASRNHIDKSARTYGILRKLGPNYEDNIAQVVQSMELELKSASPEVREKLVSTKFRRNVEIALANIDGSVNVPSNQFLATFMGSLRSIQAMSKLGSVLFSQLGDVGNIAAEFNLQGRGYLSAFGDVAGALAATGQKKVDMRRVASSLIPGLESMRASFLGGFHAQDAGPGVLNKWQDMFYRMSGMSWWTERARIASALTFSSALAEESSKALSKLDPGLQRVLKLSGIEEAEWNVVRQAKQAETIDGRVTQFVEPRAINELDENIITGYMAEKDIPVNSTSIRNTRRELQERLESYFLDSVDSAVVEPKDRTRGQFLGGVPRGTFWGETIRNLMQFKAFTLSVVNQRILRDIDLRTPEGVSKWSKQGMKGWAPALSGHMLALGGLGYMSMVLKDVSKGKTPRDPTDPKTMLAAMSQGGGMGIYGDFLFGEMKNRFGGGMAQTLAGPVFGMTGDVVDLYQRVRDGDDAGAKAFNLIYNNTPFLNLFYVRPALDAMIANDIRESLNPGYLKRQEKRMKREQGQQYLSWFPR